MVKQQGKGNASPGSFLIYELGDLIHEPSMEKYFF